ncbi:MAG: hypothetical protein M3355_10520 [Actinomycetota bacterium]|nr:hypothetical protein [Actinomycetota bacterium]
MAKRIRVHLTYANVIATGSMFLVLTGGTALALGGSNTVFSDDIVNGEVQRADIQKGAVVSSKVDDDSLRGIDIAEATLDAVPLATDANNAQSASYASEAGHAETAGYAGNAQAAENAGNLDGLDSSQFLKTDSCQRGKILGFARILGNPNTPTTYTSDPAYIDTTHNCTGGAVQIRRTFDGKYFVRFAGDPATLAVGTPTSTTDEGYGNAEHYVEVHRMSSGSDAGAFAVRVVIPQDFPRYVDRPVTLLLP